MRRAEQRKKQGMSQGKKKEDEHKRRTASPSAR